VFAEFLNIMIDFISMIIRYIAVIHLNAFITIKYFFTTNAWLFLAIISWAYVGYIKLKEVEKKNLKPKRRRY
jgi:hypothetical protein